MNVTFDTNVWEKVIDEDNHHFGKIKNKIRDGKIHAYICEIALSLESIKRQDRPEFFAGYRPSITVNHLPTEDEKLVMQICVAPNVELHPDHHPKLQTKLLEARHLGFRVLRMTNFGTIRTQEIPDEMYMDNANDDIDEFWRYAECLSSCADYITSMGCGQTAYNQFKGEFNLVGAGSQLIPIKRRKEFWKAIAEWVDGDSLAAHYAAGNEFFCTNDKARSAGTQSVFHGANRNRLETEFGIKIISSCEAAQL
ncbi:MAG: hypothetical protein OXN27_02325 [Candidatus Poribacteria bacterium]|nr:hypothetical protein [Candidatus Poribacteria bacterium]